MTQYTKQKYICTFKEHITHRIIYRVCCLSNLSISQKNCKYYIILVDLKLVLEDIFLCSSLYIRRYGTTFKRCPHGKAVEAFF